MAPDGGGGNLPQFGSRHEENLSCVFDGVASSCPAGWFGMNRFQPKLMEDLPPNRLNAASARRSATVFAESCFRRWKARLSPTFASKARSTNFPACPA